MSAGDNGVHSINGSSHTKLLALHAHRILPILSSRKECKNDGAGKPVHDEGDDAIASHQESMFLVQSRLGQEER